MQKLAKMETLISRAGREKEKCTKIRCKEAQGGSEGPKKKARLVRRSGTTSWRTVPLKGNLTICPLPEWMRNPSEILEEFPGNREVESWLEKQEEEQMKPQEQQDISGIQATVHKSTISRQLANGCGPMRAHRTVTQKSQRLMGEFSDIRSTIHFRL